MKVKILIIYTHRLLQTILLLKLIIPNSEFPFLVSSTHFKENSLKLTQWINYFMRKYRQLIMKILKLYAKISTKAILMSFKRISVAFQIFRKRETLCTNNIFSIYWTQLIKQLESLWRKLISVFKLNLCCQGNVHLLISWQTKIQFKIVAIEWRYQRTRNLFIICINKVFTELLINFRKF